MLVSTRFRLFTTSSLLLAALLASQPCAYAADGTSGAAPRKPATLPAAAAKSSKSVATKSLKPLVVGPKAALTPLKVVNMEGQVLNEDGLPVAGATVWLKNTKLQQVAITNADGMFNLTLPSDLPASLTFGYAGMREETVTVQQPSTQVALSVVLHSQKRKR